MNTLILIFVLFYALFVFGIILISYIFKIIFKISYKDKGETTLNVFEKIIRKDFEPS